MASTTTTKKASTAKRTTKKAETEAVVPESNTRESEMESLIKSQAAMIEELKKQLEESKKYAAPRTDNREKVVLLWQAPVADYNIVEFGDRGQYGRVVGNSGTLIIPKDELSQVMDSSIRYFMDKRWLIVLSGLTDEEREMFGVNYKPGEYLSKEAFLDVIGTGEKILDIYPNLCEAHKEIVAKFYYEAWRENRGVKRDIVVALNKLCKHDAFKAIIEEMNERDASEE